MQMREGACHLVQYKQWQEFITLMPKAGRSMPKYKMYLFWTLRLGPFGFYTYFLNLDFIPLQFMK